MRKPHSQSELDEMLAWESSGDPSFGVFQPLFGEPIGRFHGVKHLHIRGAFFKIDCAMFSQIEIGGAFHNHLFGTDSRSIS